MKTIKVKYVGFWDTYDFRVEIFHRILSKHYEIIESEDPDYIICSMFGEPYEYCQYPQVRIMFSGENYIPDLNLVDYAISPYPIRYLDRYGYCPICLDNMGHCAELQYKNREYSDSILDEKEYFANFIASHESENGIRGDFFKKLCEYKRVESPGTYLNNMTEPVILSHLDGSKIAFQRKCKFTLCFESTKHEGFVTEKITDAFYSDTIPVYYGSSTVKDIFNPKAFIDCSDYPSFEAAIEKIIELDQDDEKYLEMLRQPIFVDPKFPKKTVADLEQFLLSIFEQPVEKAYRRSRVFAPFRHDKHMGEISKKRYFLTQQEENVRRAEQLVQKNERRHRIHTLPNRLLHKLLGEKRYEKLRKMKNIDESDNE